MGHAGHSALVTTHVVFIFWSGFRSFKWVPLLQQKTRLPDGRLVVLTGLSNQEALHQAPWMNLIADLNMLVIDVTRDTSQWERSRLKADAELNMLLMTVTFLVFQVLTSPLKKVA